MYIFYRVTYGDGDKIKLFPKEEAAQEFAKSASDSDILYIQGAYLSENGNDFKYKEIPLGKSDPLTTA